VLECDAPPKSIDISSRELYLFASLITSVDPFGSRCGTRDFDVDASGESEGVGLFVFLLPNSTFGTGLGPRSIACFFFLVAVACRLFEGLQSPAVPVIVP